MWSIVVSMLTMLVLSANADVSHLLQNAYSTYQAALNTINGGYYYDPPPVVSSPRPIEPTPPFIPEIIVNRKEIIYDVPKHVYLPPVTEQPTIIFPPPADAFEPSYPAELPSPPTYLPPPVAEPLTPPGPDAPMHVYFPPQTPIAPQMDEVKKPDVNGGYQYPIPNSRGLLKDTDFFRSVQHVPLQLELNDLQCLSGRKGYFRANIVVQTFIEHLPIIDMDVQDQRCLISLVRTKFVLHLAGSDFARCGVYTCGDNELCLKLRFPQIDGMKSIGDAILTLQCKIQRKTVSKTQSLRFGVKNFNQARSVGTLAYGGNQQPFRTQLGLFCNVDGSFTKNLDPGAVVHLGEELILRAHVKSGDGWNHSRVTDVSLQRLSPGGDILNSATLIKSDGCVNPAMRLICPIAPVYEPPLSYRIGFRAAMFQGMKSGDEMVMRVRIVGCIDPRDCAVDQRHCSDNSLERIRRGADNDFKEDLMDVSHFSFRVEMPSEPSKPQLSAMRTSNTMGGLTAAATICCVCLLGIICFSIVNKQRFT